MQNSHTVTVQQLYNMLRYVRVYGASVAVSVRLSVLPHHNTHVGVSVLRTRRDTRARCTTAGSFRIYTRALYTNTHTHMRSPNTL